MDQLQHLEWHETSPGCHEREIDEVEQLYTSLAKTWEGTGHTYFAITACAGLSLPQGPPPSDLPLRVEKALRYGWKRLRYEHPTLAAPVEWDSSTKRCKKVYKTLSNKEDVDSWMRETFKKIETGQSGLEFANSDPPVGRYATLYLVIPPSIQHPEANEIKYDIVFRSPHDLIDGIGTLQLFNNLFLHAGLAFGSLGIERDVVFGEEPRNLSPPFRIAASIPPKPSVTQVKKLEAIQKADAAARDGAKALSLPFHLNTNMPRKSQHTVIYLTASETKAVISKCKASGVTPTHAFHAGIALAVRDLQAKGEQERNAKYISYALLNLRSSCMPPYNTSKHAAAVYNAVSSNSLVVDLKIPSKYFHSAKQQPEEFLSAMDQVRVFYQSINVNPDYLSIVPALYQPKTPPYAETPCDVPPPNPFPSVSLSSMGIIDKIIQPEHGPFTISEPWVMGAEYSTGIGLFLGSWRGIISLSAGYNEAFHDENEVLGFLERVKKIVLEGLDLDLAKGE
jgi:hypothetical protein